MNEWVDVRKEIARLRYARFSLLTNRDRLVSDVYVRYMEDNAVVWFSLDKSKFSPKIFTGRTPVTLEFGGSKLADSFTVSGLCEKVNGTDSDEVVNKSEFLVKTKLFYRICKQPGAGSSIMKRFSGKIKDWIVGVSPKEKLIVLR